MTTYTAQHTEVTAVNQDSRRTWLTIALCFAVAVLEGIDFQAPGIAARGMAAAFELDKLQMGWVFSAGILGLLPGALVGGWMADRIGRKRVLIASVALFGIFSIATAHAWELYSLMGARLLTGVGLGAALPNLIALCSEAAGERLRGTAVSLMYCGVPLGAASAAMIGIVGFFDDWTVPFYVGGVLPLLVLPLLVLWLPESAAFRAKQASSSQQVRVPVVQGLFHNGAALPTVLLWVAYFFTLMVVYMLISWLPSLLVGQGFSGVQASWVIFSLQIGATLGTLMLGVLMNTLRPLAIAGLIYIGLLAALAALGIAESFASMLVAGFAAGVFATGGQGVLYALAPLFYRTEVRATGVGSAVAVGRLGAMSGPLVAGKMLALGTGTAGVMIASAPGLVVAGIAVFYLFVRSRKNPLAN
ncbi:MFS transporter, AAHS family, 3-hydroxyphenylpropionic acid transporter [Pseudomonas linyingensis]|uniref:MFS transporter, AAHS family, 3-hydroxyphenylpropionic acid transporter n=1 Tax=Pseudomonas linyingensis TaxID=915471 RepID=A0A1H7CSM9_9PSED|nr:3-(3-hydroxy-phenyl)propionate transporter MhpT [Pseudomonas linyingensis]SEJ89730.1 MFS transporter, AAHS family, 3-hydroxyphenylpropionic acid transporter [Pseudomonas linyingensis]